MNQQKLMIVLIAVFLVYLAWDSYIKPARETAREFSGEIVELSRQREWWRAGSYFDRGPMHHSHYLHLRLSGGGVARVEVPHRLWRDAEEGDYIVKEAGKRWPEIDSSKYRERQKIREEAEELIFGN